VKLVKTSGLRVALEEQGRVRVLFGVVCYHGCVLVAATATTLVGLVEKRKGREKEEG
jgi:hypothetical protein